MPNTATKYGKAGGHLAAGNVVITSAGNRIKAIFLKSDYTPNFDTHETITDLTLASNESAGSGYNANGMSLANIVGTYSASNDNTAYVADDLAINNATIDEIKYIAIVDSTTSKLITLIILETAASPSNQQFKALFSTGFLTI